MSFEPAVYADTFHSCADHSPLHNCKGTQDCIICKILIWKMDKLSHSFKGDFTLNHLVYCEECVQRFSDIALAIGFPDTPYHEARALRRFAYM